MSGIDFTGKVALVTGASSGIGAAIAVSLAARNCRLTITGRNQEALNTTKQRSVQAGLDPQHILTVVCDLRDNQQILNLYQQSLNYHHRLDMLVNNAGVSHLDFLDDSIEKYHEIMQTNLGSTVYLTKLCIDEIIKTKGSILNVSSCMSIIPTVHTQAYCTSKAGLDHFMRCKALELGPKGVRVNNINPGGIDTPIMEKAGMPPDMIKMWTDWGHRQFQALDRQMGRPEEVASVACFLLSDRARWTTGAVVMVDAGASCLRITPDPLPPH